MKTETDNSVKDQTATCDNNMLVAGFCLNKLDRINNYANFLKQPLTIGMFVPCDDDGNVLEQCSEICACECDKTQLFRQAKSKVLFNGFVFTESQKFSVNNKIQLSVSPYGLKNERLQLTKLVNGSFHTWLQLFTIEDLIQCHLDLAVSF